MEEDGRAGERTCYLLAAPHIYPYFYRIRYPSHNNRAMRAHEFITEVSTFEGLQGNRLGVSNKASESQRLLQHH